MNREFTNQQSLNQLKSEGKDNPNKVITSPNLNFPTFAPYIHVSQRLFNLPVTKAYADSIWSDDYLPSNAVDSNKDSFWASKKTHANLSLFFEDNGQAYPINIEKVTFRTASNHFDTTFNYTIYGIREGYNDFEPISNTESRDIPLYKDINSPIYIEPILIPSGNIYRYTAIKIECTDINASNIVEIFDVLI
ncbi:hypothetical protein NLX78_07880 [Paenibacillus sp. Lou8.1]|uniref:hypothetical protein n=1 Tax=Paenibacillus sp. Lou8.1 TaxID=2962041 RepID=UPI0020B7FFE8|nr:hypothetical protein [Paenibacillus sp. Lou8.1]MCP3807151.1 hypothetical protein [Paenibacillus sp. Lou8.1]